MVNWRRAWSSIGHLPSVTRVLAPSVTGTSSHLNLFLMILDTAIGETPKLLATKTCLLPLSTAVMISCFWAIVSLVYLLSAAGAAADLTTAALAATGLAATGLAAATGRGAEATVVPAAAATAAGLGAILMSDVGGFRGAGFAAAALDELDELDELDKLELE
jgi:hypothetical protein